MYKNVYKNDEMKRSEHMAVRENVGWYYFTHYLLEVKGPDAVSFLDKVFPNRIDTLKVGRARYTTMLNEKGQIIDDVVVFRLEEKTFWISSLFVLKMVPWFDQHKGDADVTYENITCEYDMYSVQGPRALELMNRLAENPLDDLPFFGIVDNKVDGVDVKISRSGFTGEKFGYEIYIAPEHRAFIEEKLNVLSKELGGRRVTEFQIMVLTLPTEAGYYYLRDLLFTNPLEVGLDKAICWDKDFIGKEALLKVKEDGPAREMVGFTVEEVDINIHHKGFGGPGDPVYLDGKEVGRVSKLTYSYLQDTNIGYILAEKGVLKIGDRVKIRKHEGVITEKSFM